MRNAKTLMVALVAVFAFSAVAASAASATLPQFAGTTSKEFESESGVAKLKVIGGITVTCTSSTDIGKMNTNATTKKAGTVTVTFKGCKAGGEECHSTTPTKAAGSEEIETNLLDMELGYIAKGPPAKVGVLLVAAGKKTPFTLFECKFLTKEPIEVTGGVIGEITPINVMSNTFELAFTENMATGKQEPTMFEGGATEVLKTSVNKATALESIEILEHPDKITLKGGSTVKEEIEA